MAFASCTGLTSITCQNSNPSGISMGSNVFSLINTFTCVLNVPAGFESAYQVAPQWQDFHIQGLSSPVVTTLTATNIQETSATLNSDITTGDEPIAAQGWYYKKSSDDDTQWVNTTDGNLTELNQNTAYDFYAYASTVAYPLVSGDTLHFKTLDITGLNLVGYNNVKLYPNPVKDVLHIAAKSPITKVELYTLDGKMRLQENSFEEEMNVSTLVAGVYMVKVYMAQGVSVVRIIKN